MKTNELMIGDWIRWREKGCLTEEDRIPFRITEIKPDFLKIENHPCDEYIIGLFEPVSLTPEILEKNGFELYDQDFTSNKVYRFGCTDYIECLYNGDRYYFNIGAYIEYRHFNSTRKYIHPTIRVWNVHQLQHALKLCGITLNIEV